MWFQMSDGGNLALMIGLSVVAGGACLICCYRSYNSKNGSNNPNPVVYYTPQRGAQYQRYAACPVIPEGAKVISVDISKV